MNELHSLVYGDEEFLLEASRAAQHNMNGTIRRVLRAVAVQALKQQLQTKPPQHNNNNRITLTTDDIKTVQSFCQTLAQRWSDANMALGNTQVAASITDLAQRHAETLYFLQDENEEDEEPDQDNNDATTTTTPLTTTATTLTAKAVTKQDFVTVQFSHPRAFCF